MTNDVKASESHVSATLCRYVTCTHSVEEIDIKVESSLEPGNNTQSRILAVFSYVILMLYRRSDPSAAAKASTPGQALPSIQGLAAMVRISTKFRGVLNHFLWKEAVTVKMCRFSFSTSTVSLFPCVFVCSLRRTKQISFCRWWRILDPSP